MGSIENVNQLKKNQISFYVNGKLQIGKFIFLQNKVFKNSISKILYLFTVDGQFPVTTTLSYYLREVLNLTGLAFLQFFL